MNVTHIRFTGYVYSQSLMPAHATFPMEQGGGAVQRHTGDASDSTADRAPAAPLPLFDQCEATPEFVVTGLRTVRQMGQTQVSGEQRTRVIKKLETCIMLRLLR